MGKVTIIVEDETVSTTVLKNNIDNRLDRSLINLPEHERWYVVPADEEWPDIG